VTCGWSTERFNVWLRPKVALLARGHVSQAVPERGRSITGVIDATDDEPRERDLLDTPQAGPKAIRGSLLRLGGYVAGSLLSILSVSVMIRHLGVADFGRYVTATTLITIVQGVTDGGFGAIGVREHSLRTRERRDALMRSLMGVRLLSTSVGVAVATLFAAAAGYGTTLVIGTLFAGIGLILTNGGRCSATSSRSPSRWRSDRSTSA
jgi:hypothetical protein